MKIDYKKQPLSYWLESTPQRAYPTLEEDLKVDVAIIGGGFVGIATAYLLCQQGVKVAVLEAGRILQATTAHTTAKVTSQHGLIYDKIKSRLGGELSRQYAEANETAIRTVEKIAKENDIDCDFVSESAYIFTFEDGYIDPIQKEAEAASALGIKATYLEEIPLGFPIKAAVRFDHQAQFHPRKFLLPLAEKVVEYGGKIFEQSRVVGFEDNKNTLVTAKNKKVTAEKIVIASHYPCLNKPGFYFARLYTERDYIIAIRAKEKFAGGMYITAESPTRSLRNHISDDGELILVVGEEHKTGQGIDTRLHYEALAKFANEHFTVEDIPYRWSTQDCITLDEIPYVGQFTADTPNIFVATGFRKWGMTNSMVSAMMIKDLIVHGMSPWQEVYSPLRAAGAGAVGTFVVQNANVAAQLIGGKLSVPPEDTVIKPGEGQVIEAEGQRAGAFRDREGKLHLVNTTCTHMGCELQWNSAEQSWDCPCHGSRFTVDGEVIEGPAVKPLKFDHHVSTIAKLISEKF